MRHLKKYVIGRPHPNFFCMMRRWQILIFPVISIQRLADRLCQDGGRRDLLIQGDYCRWIYPTELKSWETGFSHMLNSFILTTKCSKKSTKVTQRVEFAVFYSSNERVKQPCRKKSWTEGDLSESAGPDNVYRPEKTFTSRCKPKGIPGMLFNDCIHY